MQVGSTEVRVHKICKETHTDEFHERRIGKRLVEIALYEKKRP
jgi:hypothetical protein